MVVMSRLFEIHYRERVAVCTCRPVASARTIALLRGVSRLRSSYDLESKYFIILFGDAHAFLMYQAIRYQLLQY
jgi:hypothetical protein